MDWLYAYNADLGVEALTLNDPTNIDKLLLGDSFAMEISSARGVAVFDTRRFGEAFKTHCPNGRMWTQIPTSLFGAYFGRASVRPIPSLGDQRVALNARVAVSNRNGKDGIALQVLDPFDWHDATVVIYGDDGRWLFKWEGFAGKGRKRTAHIPFEYFRRIEARRYWRAGHDEIEAVAIVAYVPVSWDRPTGSLWTAGDGYGDYEETPAIFVMKSPIPTVTWDEANRWSEE